jgi:hypothetical protein
MTDTTPLADAGATPVVETPAVVAPVVAEPEQKAEEPKTDAPEQPRGPDGKFVAHPRTEKLQNQINTLTAEKRQTEREVARLKAEAADLAKQLQQPANIDPADFEAQTAHRVRHEIKSDRLEQTAAQVRALEAKAIDAGARILNAQVEELRQHIPDIDTIFLPSEQGGPMISQVMAEAISRSENGALVAYHLKKNPSEAARIAQLDPVSALMAIGQLSAGVSAPKNQMKRISQAPAPVQTVSGGTASPSLNLETASFKDYEQARLKQMAAQA